MHQLVVHHPRPGGKGHLHGGRQAPEPGGVDRDAGVSRSTAGSALPRQRIRSAITIGTCSGRCGKYFARCRVYESCTQAPALPHSAATASWYEVIASFKASDAHGAGSRQMRARA